MIARFVLIGRHLIIEINRLCNMRILILGGGTFVGRAITEAATSRGHEITTFTRSTLPPGADSGRVAAVFGDRTEPGAFDFALDRQWDAVFDTWMGAPRIVQQGVEILRRHAPYYSYVSSCSVYAGDPLPFGLNEDSQAVDADPAAELTNYAADKRGAELAVIEGFGSNASLLARPGIILGPYERPGRLPWWLRRIAQGGEVFAPGPRDLALQYIDARDLAAWMVACAEQATVGVFNAISPSGHTNMSEMLETCRVTTSSDAKFTWVPPEFVVEQGIEQWTEMPIWLEPGSHGMYSIDTSCAARAGLTCRPISETVADTWAWLQSGGQTRLPAGRSAHGLDPEKEKAALTTWANQVH